MASQYKNVRCPGCDGTLEYNKEKKVWVCKYCGNEIRREEEYDGLYTIKNVVKQVLVDLAYLRLDSALKNLVECEKIDSSYIGTIIAEISYRVYTLITPGACQQSEMKGIYGQVKRFYQRLQADDTEISAQEEGLYETLDGNNDAFGVLLLVFDTLGGREHLDFVKKFFDAGMVYSTDLNSKLLNYGFKVNNLELINKIFANADNINCREALLILLSSYRDCEEKRTFMRRLFERVELRSDDYKQFEQYLTDTADSSETKALLYCEAIEHHMYPSIDVVMEHLLEENLPDEQVKQVVKAFAQTHPKDSELYEFLNQVFSRHTGGQAIMEISVLMESGLYIKPSEKSLRVMAGRVDWSVEERSKLLDKLPDFKLDAKGKDALFSEILLKNDEPTDHRLVLLKAVMNYIDTVSTSTFFEYVLKNNTDGDRKPEVLEHLLRLNLNMSFFRDLLNKYLQSNVDTPEVKKQITQMLEAKGLHVDSTVLLDMACSATKDNVMETVAFIQNAIKNGTRINSDALSVYLEKVMPENYKKELIVILYTPNGRISDKALANYVLKAADGGDGKTQNSLAFAEQNGNLFGATRADIVHLNARIQCNLFQAYVLTAPDAPDTVHMITAAMRNAGAKLNPNIVLNGQSVKFKKYVTDSKARLSSLALELCEGNKVFSIFF